MLSFEPTQLLLNLLAPPANLTPEYFQELLSQYGPVTKVRILNKSIKDYQVIVEMANSDAAKAAKQALDQFSSTFIRCSFYEEKKFVNIGSMETIEDTNSLKNRASESLTESLNKIVYEPQTNIHLFPQSQKVIPVKQNQKTICLSGISGVEAKQLYNIFSNFGNIDKILVINLKNFALIKYLKEEYSSFVFQNCQGLKFFDCVIDVKYSTEDAIDKLLLLDTLYQEQDYFVGSDESDRFNPNNKMVQLPPSQVLHISNLKKCSSNAETMWDIFSDFGVVELNSKAVKVLNAQFKFMCLIKMESLKQALEVVGNMHNEEIDGRNIQISFTKAKI
ncbi:hypothetical protein pb186bvf_006542 [Paramecium bursaria]